MRKIRFYQAADDVNGENVKGSIAVVADVLRATSTITTALYNGCDYVIPAKAVEDARIIAQDFERKKIILGGERKGQKIDGFDFGNSPQEYTPDAVKNKVVITTTTNGTKALVHAANAEHTLVLSFLNMSAVVDFILKTQADVSAVAAGIYGDFSIEDSICCGYLIDQLVLKAPRDFELDDAAEKIWHLTQDYKNDIEKLLRDSPHGEFLDNLGYASDLPVCAQLDACPIVPMYANGRIDILK
jgi:2-phosphosulfolactate phosphatase